MLVAPTLRSPILTTPRVPILTADTHTPKATGRTEYKEDTQKIQRRYRERDSEDQVPGGIWQEQSNLTENPEQESWDD